LLSKLSALLTLSRRELLVLALVFAVSLPAVTARLYSSDEVQYFSYLRSLWFDRDVSFENEYRYFYDHQIAQSAGYHETFLERQTATLRRVNYATMGCAVLWAPFYGVADVSVRVRRALGSDIAADGYSTPYVAAVAYGSAFYGFAAILLSIAAARRMIGPGALSSGLAVWAGTPLLFYMYVAPPFSHACSAFAVAVFVTIWLQVRQTWALRGMIALGLAGALMAMVREQDIFFTLGPALDFSLALLMGKRTRAAAKFLTHALAGCAAFAIGYLPQLLAYSALNGSTHRILGMAYPGPASDVQRKMSWHAPHALQVLFSPEHGFLFWTPLAVVSIAGLVLLAVRSSVRLTGAAEAVAVRRSFARSLTPDAGRIGGCMLLMVATQVYISGAVESWTVAGAFGQRRFVAVTIFLVVGLAAARAAARGRWARPAMSAVIILAIYWNIALMAEFGTLMMDRQRLEPRRNAYDAFVTLPRVGPRLVYRYLMQRESFYRPPATGR